FDRSEHLALDDKGFAGNASACGGRVAATAELGGDFVDVYPFAFRTEADAGDPGLDLLEDTGDDDRSDGADMIDQTFGIGTLGARAGEVGFPEPEIGDLVLVRQAEMTINM